MAPLSNELLDDVIGRVRETLTNALEDHLGESGGIASGIEQATSPQLLDGVLQISRASGQADILKALLDACRSLGSRSALFVIRNGQAVGWNGSGFENDPDLGHAISDASLDLAHPTVEMALASGEPVTAEPGGEHEVPDFGQMIRGRALVVPVVVRGQSAALLYADSADPDLAPDRAGLVSLVTVATLSVERGAPSAPHAATKSKSAGAISSPAPAEGESGEPSTGLDVSHPFADDDDDPETQDARRFARLLMDEICLYHSDRVEEARREGDVLVRLSDEIEKARRMYAERVVDEVRARGEFFDDAILSVLCAGDASLLGTPQGTAG